MERRTTVLVVPGGLADTSALASEFDVIVLAANTPLADLEMADLLVVDGSRLDALALLATLKRRLGSLPAIWLGHSWRQEEVEAAIEAGATDIAVWPDPFELVARVHVALHVHKAQSRDLLTLAYSDDLTGLANRRHLKNRLRAAVHAARMRKEPVCVLMMDLDRFKAINDTFGHPAGDRALVELAKVLRASSRATDTIGRWGGDEFLYITSGQLPAAETQAERIRQAVAAFPFGSPDLDLRLTVSIGATEVAPGDRPQDLVGRADRLLYEAKRQGRDCIVAARASRELAELA